MTDEDKSKVESNFMKNKALIYSIQNQNYLISKKRKINAKSPESVKTRSRRKFASMDKLNNQLVSNVPSKIKKIIDNQSKDVQVSPQRIKFEKLIKEDFKDYNEFILDRLAQDETIKRLYIENRLDKHIKNDSINPNLSSEVNANTSLIQTFNTNSQIKDDRVEAEALK